MAVTEGSGASVARPDQAAPLLIHDLGMGKEDGVFEILQVVIVKGKLALQGAIGDPAMFVQHGDRLAEDLIERHSGSSACGVTPQSASRAASHTSTPAKVPAGRRARRATASYHTIGGA